MAVRDIQKNIRAIIEALDDDPDREGLLDTPRRYEAFLEEFLSPDEFKPTVFTNEGYSEMIVERNITFYSMCEHHLLPFFGTATVAYIPGDKIIGLSKLARTVDHFSRRLQNQERVTTQIADFLQKELSPKGVGVVLNARHLCMEMRGIKKPGAITTTSCVYGLFRSNDATRSEFLSLARAAE
ncbi:GTP cyclohydrolase I FolE [Patescibacteria group bacterium]|nr:MAG: GTP cyclohydrolase I FolE [Patescibacteria group bacterium]